MSKLKRLLGVLSIVSLFTFSSCVDDTVSPEVTALRNAQVALLNANTSVEQATAALINANVQAQTILNTFNSANNAILLQLAQIRVDSAAAQLEVVIAKAEADLIEESDRAARAANTLEIFLATAGLNQAAEYLDEWRTIMFGGVTADMGRTSGISATRREIAKLQSDIATAKLFLGTATAEEKVRTAFKKATLERDLAKAQNDLVANTAEIASLEAEMAGFTDPTAALEAELLEFAKDTVELANEISDLNDAITAVGAEQTAAQRIKDLFEHTDPANADNFKNTNLYKEATDVKAAAEDTLPRIASEIALYQTYAGLIEAAVNTANTTAVTEIKTLYDELEKAFDDAQAALDASSDQNALRNAAILAGTKYNQELEAFKGLSNRFTNDAPNYDNSKKPTLADTNRLVQARAAFDGVTKNQMFGNFQANRYATGIGGTEVILAGAADLDDLEITNFIAAGGGAVDTGNGAFAALTGAGNPALVAARDIAQIRFEAAEEAYEDIVDYFNGMATTVSRLKANTFTSELVTVPSFNAADIFTTATPFLNTYRNAIIAANTVSPATPNDGSTQAEWNAKFPLTQRKLQNKTGAGGVKLYDTPNKLRLASAAASTNVSNHTKTSTNMNNRIAWANAQITKYTPDATPYLEDYTAAVEFLEDAARNVELEQLPLRVELWLAKELKSDISATMADIKKSINRIKQQQGGVEGNSEDGFEFGDVRTLAVIKDELNAAKDSTAEIVNEIEEAEVALLEFDIDVISDEAFIAEMEAELAARQTELVVLEALLAEYQALVLAAIGG